MLLKFFLLYRSKCAMEVSDHRFDFMTTLAKGFLVSNYHDAGRKVSKSNLDRGRKQKRLLRQTAVDAWRG